MKVNYHLPPDYIQKIAEHLHRALSNIYALYFQTLNAHWNMESAAFFADHKMLEEQYESLAQNGDEFAERIRMMGVKVDASMANFAKLADLPTFASDASADEMLRTLAEGHEASFINLRNLSTIAEEAKDYGLVDFLGTKVAEHEKTAWLLKSCISEGGHA